MPPHEQAQPPAPEPFHSLEWMHQLRDAEIRPELLALGLLMASYADKRGDLYPTLAQLALKTPSPLVGGEGASESTIKRRRAQLSQLGWIECVERGIGRGQASVYRLTFPPENGSLVPEETGHINGSAPLGESGSGVTHQERHQEQVLLPAGESGQEREGEEDLPVVAQPPSAPTSRPHQIAATSTEGQLERFLAQLPETVSPAKQLILRDALAQDEAGVYKLWQRTHEKRGGVGLLIHRIEAGEHLVEPQRICPCCGFERSGVRDLGPELHAAGVAPAGATFIACESCAEMVLGSASAAINHDDNESAGPVARTGN